MLKAGLRKTRELGTGEIAKASLVSLVVTLTGLSVAFAQAVFAARLLGATNYGTVAVAMAVVQILGVLCLSGFGDLAVREVAARMAASDSGSTIHFVRRALAIVIALSIASAMVLAIIVSTTGLVPRSYRPALEVGALLVPPIALIGLFRGTAQGFGAILQAQAPGELVRPAVTVFLLASVAVLGLDFGAVDYMWLAFAAALISAVTAAAWLWIKAPASLRSKSEVTNQTVRLNAALPFLGLGLTAMLQAQINTLLLGGFASPHEAGLFQPIVRIAPLLTLAGQAAGMRYAPRIAKHWQRGEREEIRWVTRTFTWTTSLLTLILALAIAASGPWLMVIFGSEFRQVAPLLWVIAAAQVFNAACGPVGYLLTMSGAGSRALMGQLAGLTVNALAGMLLIPEHGALGAAIAMAAGIVMWNLAMLPMATRRHGFDPTIATIFRGKALG